MSNNAATLLKEAEGLINESLKDIDEGKQVNLDPFEDKVRTLCDTLREMKKEEAKVYEDDMKNLMVSLQKVTDELVRRRDEVKDQMGQLSSQAEAQVAYKKASAYKQDNEE